jgi:uncharacterized glyoxalase superfamily protein PhnB
MPKMKNATPVFLVDDIGATMKWYKEHFGFQGDGYPASPPYEFGILTCDDVVIMLQRLEGYKKPSVYESRDGGVWDVYIRTDDVKGLYASLTEEVTVRIIEPIREQPYGETEFVMEDLNGYVLVFSQPTTPESWPQEHTSGTST